MEQLIKGKTTNGNYYVRPINWAGEWDKNGILISGNTMFLSNSERNCDIYIEAMTGVKTEFDYGGIKRCLTDNEELKRMITENPELPIMYMCGEDSYCDDFGYTINTASYEIEEVTLIDDMVCDDKIGLEEKIYSKLDGKYPDASEELLDVLTKEILEKYVWKKVITVRLG